MNQKNRFGEFIANLRREKNISQEQLCDGLCAISMLSRFERGEREPEKLMQNRFLTRLGAVPENYENFLYYKDYCRWEKRQGILHNILEEDIPEAKRLLEEYRKEYKMKDALEQQFYLAMLAQIRRYEGCDKEELAGMFEEALRLTVPEIDKRSFRNRVLSLEELNLLLEYRYCKGEDVSLQFYESLLEYIEEMERTMLALAKIYPKTVYYYYEVWKKSEEAKCSAEHMLRLCDKAIELLRDANRMFYLWELFCMKEELVPKLPAALQASETVGKSRKECREWKETLEELYQEYGVSIAMYEYCYLYVESENYCVGDVIRIRRKMLGLSQEKLSEGICDSRTVSRLEHHNRKPQKEIVQQLFDRLNLSTELCRTELVTDNQEAIEKYRELKIRVNTLNNDGGSNGIETRQNLVDLVSLDNPFNRQVLIRNDAISRYDRREISKKQYVEDMKEALECTVPFQTVVESKERYLTNEEIGCLQNMTLELDVTDNAKKLCVKSLLEICNTPRYLDNYLRMYQFMMFAVVDYLGEIGEYEATRKIEINIMGMLLKNRRLGGISETLYEIVWNDNQIEKDSCNNQSLLNYKSQIKKCCSMSDLSKNYKRKADYEERLHNIC